MRVSVVIPLYNKAPYIKECFESILSQSYSDFEVIVADDRSTDNSMAVLSEIRDPRLRVVQCERNLGPAGAAQRAMDLAQGEYMIRVDADDICLPGRFEKQVAFMDANPLVGASGGHLQLFGAETDLWRFPVGMDQCRAEVLFGNPIAQPASIMRTRTLRDHAVRFEDDWPRIGEDWILWSKLIAHAGFDNIDEPLILYRRGEQNSSHGHRRATYRETILRHVFKNLDVPFTDRQLESHLMGLRSFKQSPTRARLIGFKQWLTDLRAMNEARHLFPAAAFDKRLERAWNDVFFALVTDDARLALTHYMLSEHRNPARLSYLFKSLVGRFIGKGS
ncbi:MAG: glycosyltransferase family 2 protein [Flavobacteriales bacterium]|nr:glycosyltransferase family 2 protein [Flavobacteriales bacterium]